ncbi:MAG: threonylcarbamoyl-AMP synthase [Muribaculaceae bacterium]|nr:threonylcarbamoyl-AMP synthase [Muribaculaceae bacterium]MDY6293174.1 L-threonylcarbamoyladenylate synthase [Bacteroidales bacterium]
MTFDDDIKACIKILNEGGLILYPTDTIWGIGCDATKPDAVKRVYELKQRDDNKALIVLLDSADRLDHYVIDVPPMARELIEVAVKPLTIIYDGAFNVAHNLLGENDTLGIRIPHDEFAHRLCASFGKPIVSTSANVSGHSTARTFSEIDPLIKQGVDYVVKYRQGDNSPHVASNIIMLSSDGTFKIIR